MSGCLRRWTRRCLALGLAGASLAAPPATSRPDAEALFFGTVRRVASWFDAGRAQAPVVESSWEITATQGLPPGWVGQRLLYRVQSPDRARLEGRIGAEPFSLGRDRDELWLWRPQQALLWRARPTAADPLRPIALPWPDAWIGRLPELCVVRPEPAARVGGVPCDVMTGSAEAGLQRLLGFPALSLTLWLGQKDHRLRQVRVVLPDSGVSVTAVVHRLQEQAGPTRWSGPSSPTNRVERVTVSRVRGAFPETVHELGLLHLVAP